MKMFNESSIVTAGNIFCIGCVFKKISSHFTINIDLLKSFFMDNSNEYKKILKSKN